DLTEAALAAADRFFLDTLAAMLSGFANDECRAIVGKLLQPDSGGSAAVLGRKAGTDASMAALANGIFAHWCEWDDVHDAGSIHGSAVIYPALLAVADMAGVSDGEKAGRAFITAVVAAYDIAA